MKKKTSLTTVSPPTPTRAGHHFSPSNVSALMLVNDIRTPEGHELFSGISQELDAVAAAVSAGDLRHIEKVLTCQVHALASMLTNMVLRARKATNVEQFAEFTRLGLRAQVQCVQTALAIASLKQPPATFVHHQANIGAVQVNNSQRPPAAISQSKLMETISGPSRMDGGSTPPAISADSNVEAMEMGHRPENPGRSSSRGTKR